jgi:ferredoxin
MVDVIFKAASGATRSSTVAPGTRIMDLADELEAPVTFSCRSASCGICRVHVEVGHNLLQAASDHEREVLEALGSSGAERLACQARVGSSDGVVRLRAS